MKLLDPSAGRIVTDLDSFPLSRVLRDRQARLASLRALLPSPKGMLTCTSIFELLGNSWQIVQVQVSQSAL